MADAVTVSGVTNSLAYVSVRDSYFVIPLVVFSMGSKSRIESLSFE